MSSVRFGTYTGDSSLRGSRLPSVLIEFSIAGPKQSSEPTWAASNARADQRLA